MESDSEEQEYKKGKVSSPSSSIQRESIRIDGPLEPTNLVCLDKPVEDTPIDIAVGDKRPTWAQRTLQEEERHATPQGTFQERKMP